MNAEHMPEIVRVLREIDENPRYKVDLSILDELQNCVADGRAYKSMTAAAFKSQDDLQVVARRLDEAQWLRSRVREIKCKHMWALSALQRLWDVCCTVLYRDDEYRKVTPAPARDAKVNAALPRLRERFDNVKMICKMADEADVTLSGAYYTMRELVRINTAYLDAQGEE